MKKKSLQPANINKPSLNIRLPLDIKGQAVIRAKKNHRSLNGELVFLIETGLRVGE